jgi:phytoene dehydrogenase-like protein
VICPDLDYLEHAYDQAKYGKFSSQPYLEIVLPTMLDASLAPPGKHLMLINVQYAPYHLSDGTWDDRRKKATVSCQILNREPRGLATSYCINSL